MTRLILAALAMVLSGLALLMYLVAVALRVTS